MIKLVDPRGDVAHAASRLAPRPEPATVSRIGFLSNEEEFMQTPLHFPRYTRILQRVLPDRFGSPLQFHSEIKPVLSRPAESDQLQYLAGCDGVVNGLAK
jgi:hypothetical protein